jgi:hypothetical protein
MVKLERGLFDPAALQLAVCHGPDGGAGEGDGLAVGFGAEDAVALSRGQSVTLCGQSSYRTLSGVRAGAT